MLMCQQYQVTRNHSIVLSYENYIPETHKYQSKQTRWDIKIYIKTQPWNIYVSQYKNISGYFVFSFLRGLFNKLRLCP